jgi:hypothetical protein
MVDKGNVVMKYLLKEFARWRTNCWDMVAEQAYASHKFYDRKRRCGAHEEIRLRAERWYREYEWANSRATHWYCMWLDIEDGYYKNALRTFGRILCL